MKMCNRKELNGPKVRTCPENYTQHIGSCAVLVLAASSVGAAQQQWYDVSILEVARIVRVRTNERTDKGTLAFDQSFGRVMPHSLV